MRKLDLPMMNVSRRSVLAGGAAASAFAFGNPLIARAAEANAVDGYKALVCIFLHGGMDSYDTVVPLDAGELRDWSRTRSGLAQAHEDEGNARVQEQLIRIGTDSAGASFGLPAAMPNFAGMARSGQLAVLANVGPLRGPVTPAQLRAQRFDSPPKLYSHSHQRDYWRRLGAAGSVHTGWGGRLATAVTPDDPFGAVTASRDEGFTLGVEGPGITVGRLNPRRTFGLQEKMFGDPELAALFKEHLSSAAPGASLLEQDFAARQGDAASMFERLSDLMGNTDEGERIAGRNRPGTLRHSLAIIAKTIALRERTETRRQIFYVSFGNFDTHQDQASRLPPLQAELDDALGAFMAWLADGGLGENVTVFTASEFGRTLVPNKTGTDHGWGGHQFVMGGAVNGGRIFGDVPPPVPGHPLDTGRGRLVPTLAVEQMAVPLARWLGVPDADMSTVFPYASRFDTKAVPLMKT